jgi:hypothetical protein
MSYIKRLPTLALLGLVALVSFGATAIAADAATSSTESSSLLDLLKPVYDAFAGGHYAYAAALGVIAAVALVKRYAGTGKFGAFVHSDAGGSLMALLMAGAGAMASGLAAPDAHVTWSLLKTAMLVGAGAAGGYALLKNLLVDPILKPLSKKAPAWMQPLFALLFMFFDHGAAGEAALAKAEAAGDAAVAAKPGEGIAAVTGEPDKVN